MSWLAIAIIAYLLLAIVNIGDKLFLGNFVPNYKAYTSLVGVLAMIMFVIAPWFLIWPGAALFWVSMVSGVMFVCALLAFFYSLQVGQASRVIPFVGGLVPIFSLLFSVMFLGDSLSQKELLAFTFLLVGSVVIVRLPHQTHWWEKIWNKIHPEHKAREISITVLASVLFAGSFVASKYVYDGTEFLSGFMWIRLGSFIAVLFLLINRDTRKAFMDTISKLGTKSGGLFLTNQVFGAGGFFLQSVAISLGSVALVNALQGVQYVFVIVLAVIASMFFPKLAGDEDINAKIIAEKIAAVAIIAVGLWLLSHNF